MTAQNHWEILDGLPVYGPMAEPFTATGRGTHSQGLVVQFHAATGTWVGNFQRGLSSYDTVFEHPDGRHVVVVAGGTAYVVDPRSRALSQHFGADIEHVYEVPVHNLVILGNGLWFEAIGKDGTLWESPRLSWDGMRNVTLIDETVRGEAYSPEGPDGAWYPFELDVTNGAAIGGSYNGPPM